MIRHARLPRLRTALLTSTALAAFAASAPDPVGSALMATAGVAWGLYSLRGRGGRDPLAATAGNFLRSLPLVALVGLVGLARLEWTRQGAWLAVASGALASGVGYAIWYAALRGLSATLAATVQLSVPVLAALGGVIFMAEAITLRVLGASTLILGGVACSLFGSRAAGSNPR